MKKFCFIFILFLAFCRLVADDDDKLKLAVMDLEDLSGKLSEETLTGASEYFRVIFAQTNRYIIISKDRQKDQISSLRKQYNTDPSYKSCTDKNCQIQLGQALSADLIVKTSVSFFAGFYTLASELIDLEKEATIIAATEEYDGTPQALRTAIKNIVKKIVQAETEVNAAVAVTEKKESKPRNSKDAIACEYARSESNALAWETYLKKYPDGECAAEAKDELDKMACKTAEKKNSAAGWREYLQEFPDGRCEFKAQTTLQKFEVQERKNIEQQNRSIAEQRNFDSKADEKLDGKFSGRFNWENGIGDNGGSYFGFGTGIGFDFDWKIYEKPYGGGAGNLFLGFGFDFQYWIPIEFAVPVQLNFGYEFKLNNQTLRYIGFWTSMGVNLNFLHLYEEEHYYYDSYYGQGYWYDEDEEETFSAGYTYQFYMNMIFGSRFTMDFGMIGAVHGKFMRTAFLLDLGCIF